MRLLERPGTLRLVHRLSSYVTTSGYRNRPMETPFNVLFLCTGNSGSSPQVDSIVIGCLSEDDVAHESRALD